MELIIIDANHVYKNRLINLLNSTDLFDVRSFISDDIKSKNNSSIFLIDIASIKAIKNQDIFPFFKNNIDRCLFLTTELYVDINSVEITSIDKELLKNKVIYKYQSFKNIYNYMTRYIGDRFSIINSKNVETNNRLISIFSPITRCKEEVLSMCIADIISKNKKTLLISLSGEGDFTQNNDEELSYENRLINLSEIIYMYKNKQLQQLDILENFKKIDDLYIIDSLDFYEDYTYLDDGCIKDIIENILDLYKFDYVVLYVGGYKKSVYDIFDISSHIFMPILRDKKSKDKISMFLEFLRKRYNHLLEKIQFIEMDDFLDQDYEIMYRYIQNNIINKEEL